MDYMTAENDAGTNPEQSETAVDFRVSYESRWVRLVRPPRPGNCVAWGDVDEKAKLLPVWTPDGLWHVMDMRWPGSCYFIGGDKGPVKIGHSADIEKRLADLRPASPIPLRVLAATAGGRACEKHYHWKFRRVRLHGEWFRRSDGIRNEIARLNAQCPYVPFLEVEPRLSITPKQEGPSV